MKYYICQTPEGPQLEGTQSSAKVLDPNFKEHHVPDGKDDRMAYVNALLIQAPASDHKPKTKEVVIPTTAKVGFVPKVNPADSMAVPIASVDIHNRIAVEEALWATDQRGLKTLEDVIAERRKELDAVAARDTKKVAPPPRRRAPPTPPKRRRPPA